MLCEESKEDAKWGERTVLGSEKNAQVAVGEGGYNAVRIGSAGWHDKRSRCFSTTCDRNMGSKRNELNREASYTCPKAQGVISLGSFPGDPGRVLPGLWGGLAPDYRFELAVDE